MSKTDDKYTETPAGLIIKTPGFDREEEEERISTYLSHIDDLQNEIVKLRKRIYNQRKQLRSKDRWINFLRDALSQRGEMKELWDLVSDFKKRLLLQEPNKPYKKKWWQFR